jgi:hypothetical protein
MQSIVYGNLRIEILTDVGSRLERVALQRVMPQPLGRQPTGPASGKLQTLLGREEELGRVRLAIQAGEPIELIAACGFGKTGLLRQLAAVDGGEDLTRAWVYLRLGKEQLDDTLQRLFDASYSSPQPFKPTTEQRAQLLGQVNSVILLDDVALGAAEVGQLVANLAGASVVVASTRPVLGRQGMSMNLAGLSDAAAVDLVASDLGRPLTAAEDPAVRALAQAVDGQPLRLHQAAALAREDGGSLEELATRAANDPQVLDRLSVNALAEQERRVLAVLALAGGALLPRELIGAFGDVATIGASLGLLRRRGLVEQEQDRFGLPICHVNAHRELLLQHLQLGGALGTMSDWLLARDPTSDQARSAIGGAVNAIGYAAEHGQWGAVVRLVKVLEPILTLTGRWEAARDVLNQGLAAARQLGDEPAGAWFSHQLGTLEVSLDELAQGRAHLEEALRLREQLQDHAGAAVSRHNLAVLDAPIIKDGEPPPRRSGFGEWVRGLAGRWPRVPPILRRRRERDIFPGPWRAPMPGPEAAGDDPVSFTIGYPGIVSPQQWRSLYVFVHLLQMHEAVDERIRQQSGQLGLQPTASRVVGHERLPRGTVLLLKPQVVGFSFNPLSQEIRWLEDVQEIQFRFTASPAMAGQVVVGEVLVAAGPLLVASIPLSIRVAATDRPVRDTEPLTTAHAQLFHTVFASYAHEDVEVVRLCVEVYRALGIEVLIDKDSLRSGQDWRQMLMRLIEDADLFQLFWSQASSKSRAVEEEWSQALSLQGRKGGQFIRPMYWQRPWPKPPQPLSHIHFAFLDLTTLEKLKHRKSIGDRE